MCLVASVTPVSAQEATGLEDLESKIQILRVEQDPESSTVELVVALPAAIGEVAPTPENFGITEGGSRRSFIVEEIDQAVDITLVIDTSGSMRGAPLQEATRAASDFIGQLPDSARVSIISFGAQPQVLTAFTDSRDASKLSVNSLQARGETALWDALVEASRVTSGANSEERYIILLSDGGDTTSEQDQETAVSALTEAGAALYAITLETAESDHSALISTAASVGGTVLTTDDPAALRALYGEIGDRLNHRYRILFSSTETGERRIGVSVAIDGAVATAKTTVETAESDSATPAQVATNGSETVKPDLVGESILGAFTAPSAGLVGGTSLWLGAAALFVALLSVAVLAVDPFGTRVQSLGTYSAASTGRKVSGLGQRAASAADRAIAKHDDDKGLDQALDAAGINMRPGEFAMLSLGIVIAFGLGASILWNAATAIVVVLIGSGLVLATVSMKISRRRKKFAEQLHSTITILVGSMRAGRGLPQALELVASEASSPTAEEFRRVTVESRVGRDQVASLEAVAERMKNEDLRWIAQAIGINKELGGDLTELLDNLASVIRDRGRLKLQVQSLSAEGRMSAWVVGALPVAIFAYMHVTNRDYVRLLYTTNSGLTMFVAGLVFMLLGSIWMKKLVDIRY